MGMAEYREQRHSVTVIDRVINSQEPRATWRLYRLRSWFSSGRVNEKNIPRPRP